MGYVGKPVVSGEFIKLDTINVTATATFDLKRATNNFYPSSASQLIVSLNGVTQAPNDAYTISGATITFASALAATDVIDYILVLGETGTATVPVDGSVTAVKLSSAIARGESPIRINTNTIAANQTIASSENGFIAGPVTINTGVTLTVNGTFTVV